LNGLIVYHTFGFEGRFWEKRDRAIPIILASAGRNWTRFGAESRILGKELVTLSIAYFPLILRKKDGF
jgi:hypothetical protein